MSVAADAPCRAATSLAGVRRLDLGPRTKHENRARAVSGADDHVAGLGRAVEVVPHPQRSFLLLDDQRALAGEHEEPLLGTFRVIERVRLSRPEDGAPDTDVPERRVARLERIRGAALLLVAHGERVPEVEHDQPSDVM